MFEPLALSGNSALEEVALAASVPSRPTAEAQFVEKLRAGDAAAFERLVCERSGEVYGVLYRLTSDAEEARDLTQDTFLRAFQSVGSFRGEADIKTWLYRIALNLARNRWRWWKRKRRDVTLSLDAPDALTAQPLSDSLRAATPNPEQAALAREREAALHAALRQWDVDHRVA